MKKNNVIILLIIFCISFIFGIEKVSALTEKTCNINVLSCENGNCANLDRTPKGYGYVVVTPYSGDGGTSKGSIGKWDGCFLTGWKEEKEVRTYFVTNTAKINSWKFDFYGSDKEKGEYYICTLNSSNVANSTGNYYEIDFYFNITSGHVDNIKASFNYGDEKETKEKKLKVCKKKKNDDDKVINKETNEDSPEILGEAKDAKVTSATAGFATKDTATSSSDAINCTTTIGADGKPVTKADGSKLKKCDINPAVECKDIVSLINKYWNYIMFLAPVALILLTTFDLTKAVIGSDADAIKKASKAAVNRTIAVVVLCLLPPILGMILNWFGLELCIN